ncbi:hypothetical protein FACS1894147_04990 [Spirochaetia bacterium]|nr:hypothetical protein FACS1894147_04990 [Spirochaetia bacterium]
MKRNVLFLVVLLGLGAAVMVPAQGRDRKSGRNYYPPVTASTEVVTLSGNLTIVQGSLALKSGGVNYLTPGLMRYVGFIDNLKDGAAATIEGVVVTDPLNADVKALYVNKLTIGGKDYDLARPTQTITVPQSRFPFGRR